MCRDLGGIAVGEDADQQRAVAGRVGGAGGGDERRGLVFLERARRAGHEVEADGVGTGGDGCGQPGRLGDAADLDERRAAIDGRVHARGRARRRRATSVATRASTAAGSEPERMRSSPTSAASKPQGAPAADRGGIADARFGHHDAVVGDECAQPVDSEGVDLERLEVAVVDADEAGVGGQWPPPAPCPSAPPPAAPGRPRARRARASRGAWAGCSAASSSTASAPAARSSGSCRGSTTNSLASTGSVVAARAARRSSSEPPNQCGSTSTEIIEAPPAW